MKTVNERISELGLVDAKYIGDGVYMAHDNGAIWLLTDRWQRGIHEIALEPGMVDEVHKELDRLMGKVR